MEKATISELKNRLSAYLKKVRAGESVLITDRNEPVARLVRVGPEGSGNDRLIRLESVGALRRSCEALSLEALLSDPVPRAQRSVLGALLDDRQQDR